MAAPVLRQRDPERTKAEILEVATQAFAEAGYAGARVDEIAERTRTTKRMIYYYFGGKEQLYLAVLERAYRGIREVEEQLDVGGLAPVDAIRRLAELTYDHHVAHEDFVRLVTIENIQRGQGIRRLEGLRDLARPATEVLEGILRRGIDAGAFRADVAPLDVHLLISSYCVFQVANQHTFGYLFDVDLLSAETRPRLRALIGDVVVSWLAAPAASPSAVPVR